MLSVRRAHSAALRCGRRAAGAAAAASAYPYPDRFDLKVLPGVTGGTEGNLQYKKWVVAHGTTWAGTCDSASLAALWPACPPGTAAEAAALLTTYEGVCAKLPELITGRLGRAQVRLQAGDFAAAQVDIDYALGVDDAKVTPEQRCFALGLRAVLAEGMIRKAEKSAVACVATPALDKAEWVRVARDSYLTLQKERPGDWKVTLAHGAHMLRQGEFVTAETKLRVALDMIESEILGREATPEYYLQDQTSAGAMADYLDYKHETSSTSALGDVLYTRRTDAAMEKLLASRYGVFSPEELRALVAADAAKENGDYGLLELARIAAAGDSVAVESRHVYAQEVVALMADYTGGARARVMSSDAPIDEVLAELKGLPDNATGLGPTTPEALVRLQKNLGVRLVRQQRDTCKTLIGKAALAQGDGEGADKILSEVVTSSSYLGMHGTLHARGDAYMMLGKINAADKDYKVARSLEVSPPGSDVPTMDLKAFRDDF